MSNPRLSIRLKALRGTVRADRAPAGDPAARLSKCPGVPAGMSKSAAAEWVRLAPVAHRLGTLTEADLRGFELLCATLATERAASDQVELVGMTTATADGGLKPHPAVRIMETARAQSAALLASFGLTPKGRQSIDTAPPPANALHDQYFDRGR